MNKQEFVLVADMIKTYFPKENLFPNKPSLAVWYEELKDLDFRPMVVAVRYWARNNKWCPTIADLRSTYKELTSYKLKGWGDGWREVLVALHKFGNEVPPKDFFSDATSKAVESIGWDNIFKGTGDKEAFKNAYEKEMEPLKEKELLLLESKY